MNIQIFGTDKCFDTKKAQRYFKERNMKFQYINLKVKGLSKREPDSAEAAVAVCYANCQKRQAGYCRVCS